MHAPGGVSIAVMEITARVGSGEFRVESFEFRVESFEFRVEKPQFSKGGD